MRDENPLITLLVILAPLSLGAVGGAASIYAPLQHQVVQVHPWLSAADFLDLFAVSRVMPGPGSFIATLIGWRIDGWSGAAIATLAIFLPSSVLVLAIAGVWSTSVSPAWRTAVEKGLIPIGSGLMAAGVYSVMRLSAAGLFAWALLIASAAAMVARPKVHPLWILFCGGLLSLAWTFVGGA